MDVVKLAVKNLESDDPVVALEAAKDVMKQIGPKKVEEPKRKSVTVDMIPARPEVTFVGGGWCAMDIKFVYAAIKRAFREQQREFYRKEYEKK